MNVHKVRVESHRFVETLLARLNVSVHTTLEVIHMWNVQLKEKKESNVLVNFHVHLMKNVSPVVAPINVFADVDTFVTPIEKYVEVKDIEIF